MTVKILFTSNVLCSVRGVLIEATTNHRFCWRSTKTTLPRYQPAALPPLLSCHICSDRGVPISSGHFIRKELISPRPKFYIQPRPSILNICKNSKGTVQNASTCFTAYTRQLKTLTLYRWILFDLKQQTV